MPVGTPVDVSSWPDPEATLAGRRVRLLAFIGRELAHNCVDDCDNMPHTMSFSLGLSEGLAVPQAFRIVFPL